MQRGRAVFKSTTEVSYIFIDVNMPRMDGYQCAKVLRDMSAATIVLTSDSFNPSRQRALKLSNIRYLQKCGSVGETVESLHEIFSLSH